MDPEDFQQIQEAMPNIQTVREFGVVVGEERSPPETTVYIDADNGGVRFPIDAIRAEDMAEFFEQLSEDLAVES